MDDSRIIELYFARDERAIKETKAKYGRLLLSVARGILGNRQDSEECESDTYIKAWNSIPPERPTSLSAYLSKIARNLAINRYHSNNRKCEMDLILDELSEVVPDTRGDLAEELDLKDALEGFVSELDLNKRLIFLKRYFYMMSVMEIALDMHMSAGTVKSSLSRTRIALRKYLTERGITI